MCLAIPGRVLETHTEGGLRMARVEFGGVGRDVCIEYVPDAAPGDYVLVHVGFALSLVDEEEARRLFELLRTLGQGDELPDEGAEIRNAND